MKRRHEFTNNNRMHYVICRELTDDEQKIVRQILASFPHCFDHDWGNKFRLLDFNIFPKELLTIAANAYDNNGNTVPRCCCGIWERCRSCSTIFYLLVNVMGLTAWVDNRAWHAGYILLGTRARRVIFSLGVNETAKKVMGLLKRMAWISGSMRWISRIVTGLRWGLMSKRDVFGIGWLRSYNGYRLLFHLGLMP